MILRRAEAAEYAGNLSAHMSQGDVALRRRFLSAFVKRIVVYDDDGTIELLPDPALGALETATPLLLGGKTAFLGRLGRKNIPLDGTPDRERAKGMTTGRVLHFTLQRTRRR